LSVTIPESNVNGTRQHKGELIMLKNPPLIGNFSIIQTFGDNPEEHAQTECAGFALRGHNGLDFSAPEGTPVYTVQDGIVLRAESDPTGFGNFVVVGHSWGQSHYCHLLEIEVQAGERLVAGNQIGSSGASGQAASPQLHFGMRITPFSVRDEWCGFSDPAPYLARLTEPLGAIIGPHIIGGISQKLDTLRRWQPRMVLVLDPNRDAMSDLRAACPQTVIIGRIFEPDSEVESRIRNDPATAARWAHDKVMSRFSPDVDYWQIANEILQGPDDLHLLNTFEQERMKLAEAAGYRCAILAFSVGNPDLPEGDRMAAWRKVYPAIEQAEKMDHVVALHQYGMPDLWGPNNAADWYIYRMEHKVLRRIPYKRVKFAVTEYGIDGLIQGGSAAGWQTFTDAQGYADQLLKSGTYLERFCGRVLGYAVFTMGHTAPWGTYDIDGEVANILADSSEKGTWSDLTTIVDDIQPDETDTTSDPGGATTVPDPGTGEPGTGEPGTGEPGTGEPGTGEPGTGEPGTGEPGTGEPGGEPQIERRISPWVAEYNISMQDWHARPDNPTGDVVYLIKDIFTTMNGSWEPTSEPGSIPQWARDDYLKAEFLEAGADHHLFAAVIGLDGQMIKAQPVSYWSDGFERLGDPDYDGYIQEQTKQDSSWANMFMASGSSFVPERGESGPWCWMPDGVTDVMCGGGLPSNQHLSIFAVWQAVRREDLGEPGTGEPGTGEPGTGEPGTGEPGTGEPGGGTPTTEFNIQIRPIADRPDSQSDEIIFVVKDMFTTVNGSWEPTDESGSVPQWARDDYLKPFGAPDYFDDAGGDHHLFAAVIGLDGELIGRQEIRYWSDGFEKLGDPTYSGYTIRETKEHSGWINIPIGPGSSFVPERGESGPWCWVPAGTADVVCGGGLPARRHISTFVVWQAVRRDDVTPPDPGTGDDHTIFLPIFMSSFSPGSAANEAAGSAAPAGTTAPHPAPSLLRREAGKQIGLSFDPESALATYARQQGLGMPVSQEFSVEGFRVQAFYGGIAFAHADDPSQVGHTAW
jgi:hypothetical protein